MTDNLGPIERTSKLEYVPFGRASAQREVVIIHDRLGSNGEFDDLAQLMSASAYVVVPRGFYGEYSGAMDLFSRLWFFDWVDHDRPDVAMFGRSLYEIERLLVDLSQLRSADQPGPVFWGVGQGATLGAWLAQVNPGLFSKLLLIDPRKYSIPGWNPTFEASADLEITVANWHTRPDSTTPVFNMLFERFPKTTNMTLEDNAELIDQLPALGEWV